jgi:uncharacterized cupin superfamily protein
MAETVACVRRLDAAGVEPKTPAIAADDVLSDRWEERSWPLFERDGRLHVGTWRGEPGRLRIADQPYDEISVLSSGAVALSDLDGSRVEFGPGDRFVVERGFSGVWETLAPTEKVYVVYSG